MSLTQETSGLGCVCVCKGVCISFLKCTLNFYSFQKAFIKNLPKNSQVSLKIFKKYCYTHVHEVARFNF